MINDAYAATPTPGPAWRNLGQEGRINLVSLKLSMNPDITSQKIHVVAAQADGEVILRIEDSLPAHLRGPFLLDLEGYLKLHIDDAINLWLEPLGDKNTLRNLRGIKFK